MTNLLLGRGRFQASRAGCPILEIGDLIFVAKGLPLIVLFANRESCRVGSWYFRIPARYRSRDPRYLSLSDPEQQVCILFQPSKFPTAAMLCSNVDSSDSQQMQEEYASVSAHSFSELPSNPSLVGDYWILVDWYLETLVVMMYEQQIPSEMHMLQCT